MKKPFTLYGRPGSGSLAVQVALEEIGVPYERIWVGAEHAEVARYKELNPTGEGAGAGVSSRRHADVPESAAILIHLALLNPDAKLAPQPGTTRHAAFLQWMCFLSANVYEAVLRIYYSARYSPRGEADANVIREQGSADLVDRYVSLHRPQPQSLRSRRRVFDCGCLFVHARVVVSGRLELNSRLPALAAHGAKVAARPAVAKVDAVHAAHATTVQTLRSASVALYRPERCVCPIHRIHSNGRRRGVVLVLPELMA